MAENPEKLALNPRAISVANAAQLLSRLGERRVTADMLAADIEAGAPTNDDGTMNLVDYAAWLVKEMSQNRNGD